MPSDSETPESQDSLEANAINVLLDFVENMTEYGDNPEAVASLVGRFLQDYHRELPSERLMEINEKNIALMRRIRKED